MKILLSLSCCLVFATGYSQHSITKIWESPDQFKVPESVLYSPKENLLFVTNIDGKEPWGKDGAGSVGKLGLDGKIIAVEWVKGLNAPKGMGEYNGKLYVADLGQVVVINISSGQIDHTISVEGAEGLNDITIDPKGVVFVSDSKQKAVFRIQDKTAEKFLDGLKDPNGLLFDAGVLYVLDNGGLYKVDASKKLVKITDGMEGGTDGIEQIGNHNEFIVSCWAGQIFYVNSDGTKQNLLDSREQKINTADIGFDPAKKIIYIPTFWKNSVMAYQFK